MAVIFTRVINKNNKIDKKIYSEFFNYVDYLSDALIANDQKKITELEARLKLFFIYDPLNFCISEVLTLAFWESELFLSPTHEYLEFSLSGIYVRKVH